MKIDDLLDLPGLDHATLLLILPFGIGYIEDSEKPDLACNLSLTFALTLHAANFATDPLLRFAEQTIN